MITGMGGDLRPRLVGCLLARQQVSRCHYGGLRPKPRILTSSDLPLSPGLFFPRQLLTFHVFNIKTAV